MLLDVWMLLAQINRCNWCRCESDLNSLCRLFRAYVAGEDEERALSLLDQMATLDLQDPDVRLLLLQTLQPHYVAAADSPEAAEALETLPRVRRKVDELLGGDIIPDTDLIM